MKRPTGRGPSPVAVAVIMTLVLAGLLTAGPGMAAGSGPQAAETVARIIEAVNKRFPDVPRLEAGKLLTPESRQQVVLVDVRSAPEQAVSMLPKAITFTGLKRNFKAYAGRTIVPYCTTGFRSANLVRALKRYRIKAYNLSGGILAWVHAGGRVFDDKGQTKRVHVFGDDYDVLPEGYIAVH